MAFYGKPIAKTIGRLTQTAAAGSSTIYVTSASVTSWAVGDMIGLAATSYSPDEQEIVTITSINKVTG